MLPCNPQSHYYQDPGYKFSHRSVRGKTESMYHSLMQVGIRRKRMMSDIKMTDKFFEPSLQFRKTGSCGVVVTAVVVDAAAAAVGVIAVVDCVVVVGVKVA